MGGLLAPLAVAVLVYYQNALLAQSSSARRIGGQEFQAALVDLPRVPPRFRKEPLQALGLPPLCSGQGFGVGQGGQRLVAFGRKQEPFEITPEALGLCTSTEEIVEAGGVVLQRTGGR